MKRVIEIVIIFCLSLFYIQSSAQIKSSPQHSAPFDSVSQKTNTWIGGYGNAFFQRDFNLEYSKINLERFVLFAGHKFNQKISFFSELEVEDAKVEGGEEGGELALEQCYLQFNFDADHYMVAGLFLPRLGILNENHLPNSFNGNERTQVETFIIPSTWRELGVGYYGSSNQLPINYSFALMNGLNSEGFEHGTGIRGGRFEGSNASANNMSVTGALQYYHKAIKAQVSGYVGGSVGLAPHQADSLQLTSGMFGTPVMLGEVDVQYESKGLTIKILGTLLSIPDASDINQAYANNTPEEAFGAYAELSYDVLYNRSKSKPAALNLFARYEKMNLNSKIPENGIIDNTLDQDHIIFGFSYLPINNVAVKADFRLTHTGDPNPVLLINPNPNSIAFEENNSFLNIGIGFSF